MAEPGRPQSPFFGLADFSARTPLRVLSSDEIERMLAEHRLYLETEYHQGHRANFASADLSGRDFSGRDLRGIQMDRAMLRGADFSGANLRGANLIGAIAEQARFDHADLFDGVVASVLRCRWRDIPAQRAAAQLDRERLLIADDLLDQPANELYSFYG
jgi:hypothetical protein